MLDPVVYYVAEGCLGPVCGRRRVGSSKLDCDRVVRWCKQEVKHGEIGMGGTKTKEGNELLHIRGMVGKERADATGSGSLFKV